MTAMTPVESCAACGSKDLTFQKILWDELVQAWRISEYERDYIDRQQGLTCRACGCNLRSMALALAVCGCYGYADTLKRFVQERSSKNLRVLEVNEAGGLTQFLSKLPKHCLKKYPELDMMHMPYEAGTFDLVVHSDTLEHVPHPITGLTECRRVLKPGGFCAFTIPIIVDRLTFSRVGLPPSYHDTPQQRGADFAVHTEYGSDAWKHLVLAGFQECRLIALEFPAALAFVGAR
jgi:SAM-dependent methyltransferase